MDIPSLELFITLSRNLHFGKTSEEMHMSPSAVSRALQRIEDQLGHPLVLPSTGQVRKNINVWRGNHSISPNLYGEVRGNEAILSLVAMGWGVGFVPELVIKDSPLADQVEVLEDGPDLENFHVGFCTRRKSLETSPIIRAFWESIPIISVST